jgi:hypothetical protein
MAKFALCCGAGGTRVEGAAAHWQALGLQQLVFGESGLDPTPERRLVQEVPHTPNDEPCLRAMLTAAADLTAAPWLLVVPADAHLTPTAVRNLSQLARRDQPRQLVIGRAWRLPQHRFSGPSSGHTQAHWDEAIAAEGRLDPPTLFSWVLLPRAALLQAPMELGSSPSQAVPWLVDQARLLGWPVLEASSTIPVLRPAALSPNSQPGPSQIGWPDCTGVVLPHAPGTPRLSVLVAAPQRDLEALAQRLRPVAALPWEVILRPHLPDRGPGAMAAAWNSALADARGDLVWPLAVHPPALACLPLVLRLFDAPWVDLAQFACRLGQQHYPADDPYRVEPGCLLGQRSWLQRLGGFDESLDGRRALQDLKQRALDRGASIRSVPLEVFAT